MPTHQEIANVTDQEMVERMVSSHADRFDDMFWEFMSQHVAPGLPAQPSMLDIGCGPGLLLKDLSARYQGAQLTGTDVTGAMIDYAEAQTYQGARPAFHLHDVTREPLPVADHSVDLVSMVAVLHVLTDPFQVLREIKRVLSPSGQFLLQDWIRRPLPEYLTRMMPQNLTAEQQLVAQGRFLALFTVHNKYTTDDWIWVLNKGGFKVGHQQELRSPHFRTFVCTPA